MHWKWKWNRIILTLVGINNLTLWTYSSPGLVVSMLPPASAARSTTTEPSRIDSTNSFLIRMGAFLPDLQEKDNYRQNALFFWLHRPRIAWHCSVFYPQGGRKKRYNAFHHYWHHNFFFMCQLFNVLLVFSKSENTKHIAGHIVGLPDIYISIFLHLFRSFHVSIPT